MFLTQLPSGDFGILKVDYPRVPPEQENNTGISGNREIPGFTRIPFSRHWNYPRSPFKTPNLRQTSRKPQFGGFNTNSITPSVPAALSRGEQGNSRPCRGILDFFFFALGKDFFPVFLLIFPVFSAQMAGLLCEEEVLEVDNVKYCGYCKYHFNKMVSLGPGISFLSGI